MKKILVLIVAVALLLSACNWQAVETIWDYDRAMIQLPNGEVTEGRVQSWKAFSDGGWVQVKIDGITYLTHSTNVALLAGEGLE